MNTYILDGRTPVACDDMMLWGDWMNPEGKEPFHRTVRRDSFIIGSKEYCDLSTVFLGIDYNFGERGSPVLFESMVFGGEHLDESMDRYCTWAEAAIGHSKIFQRIDKIITSRYKIEEVKEEHIHDRITNFRYVVKGSEIITFNESDVRLIRED